MWFLNKILKRGVDRIKGKDLLVMCKHNVYLTEWDSPSGMFYFVNAKIEIFDRKNGRKMYTETIYRDWARGPEEDTIFGKLNEYMDILERNGNKVEVIYYQKF
ncbi:MAG: hypothetical protein GXO63_00390 [Candidatus Micrarchaeota archaeon]|nr:hypothetical protein [Candidatus Micrarchaeota archaeon]